MQQGPRVSLYMVLIAIIAAIFSTFWTFGYTRLARRVRRYARSSGTAEAEKPGVKIQKRDVKRTLRNGLTINVVGMGAALLGLQAMVGMLVCSRHRTTLWSNVLGAADGCHAMQPLPPVTQRCIAPTYGIQQT